MFFLLRSLPYPLHIDSELTQTLNYFRLWMKEKKSFWKTQFNPPPSCGFSHLQSAEDPNLHISTFLRLSGTLKANQEAVRLHLFPFSLRDRASAWFHSLEIGSITSWDQMRQAFLARFFPPSKTAKLRDQIRRFNQKDGESLYDAWERFKEMLILCHHHDLEKWLIVHTFYNGL